MFGRHNLSSEQVEYIHINIRSIMFKKRKSRADKGAAGRSKFRRKNHFPDGNESEPEESVAERLAAVREEQSSRGRTKGVESESLMASFQKVS